MKSKKIKFEVDYDKNLEVKILLELMSLDFDSFTLLTLSQALGNKYKIGSKGWDQLRFHLIDMEKRGLIEERHFNKDSGDNHGKVDYSIENKGITIARKLMERDSKIKK